MRTTPVRAVERDATASAMPYFKFEWSIYQIKKKKKKKEENNGLYIKSRYEWSNNCL